MQHRIIQAEGGEQGDPLMPLLFSLAIHDPQQQAQREFRADENLFATGTSYPQAVVKDVGASSLG